MEVTKEKQNKAKKLMEEYLERRSEWEDGKTLKIKGIECNNGIYSLMGHLKSTFSAKKIISVKEWAINKAKSELPESQTRMNFFIESDQVTLTKLHEIRETVEELLSETNSYLPAMDLNKIQPIKEILRQSESISTYDERDCLFKPTSILGKKHEPKKNGNGKYGPDTLKLNIPLIRMMFLKEAIDLHIEKIKNGHYGIESTGYVYTYKLYTKSNPLIRHYNIDTTYYITKTLDEFIKNFVQDRKLSELLRIKERANNDVISVMKRTKDL